MHELCLLTAEPVRVEAFGLYCVFLSYISIALFFFFIMVKTAIDDRKWKVQETLRGANRLVTEEMRQSFRQLTSEMREKYLAMVKVQPEVVSKEIFDSEMMAVKQRLRDLERLSTE